MEKRYYSAPQVKVMDIESTTIMAGSLVEQSDGSLSGNMVAADETQDAQTARVASNEYFNSWDDDEE